MSHARTTRKTCRFSPEELLFLEREAHKAGMRTSTFIRESALAYLKRKYLIPIGVEDKLTELIQKIVRIGNNHDRILAKVSTFQRVTLGDIHQASRNLYEAERLLLDFFKNPPQIYDA